MKILNRGYLVVNVKAPFIQWANQFEDGFQFDESDELEPNVYLIEEDFFDNEQMIRQHFKKIFFNELSALTEDKSLFPVISEELFHSWFNVTIGTTVFDVEKSDLQRSSLD